MSDNPSNIRAISTTRTSLDNSEYFEGVDAQGRSFKVAPSNLAGVKMVTTGLVASTTHTLIGATPLNPGKNIVSTVASTGDAVALPPLGIGQSAQVYNAGAYAMSVFPNASGVAIDGGSAGAAVTLSAGKRADFTCFAANVIVSAQLGVAAA